MARKARVSPHNISCSFCKTEFFPSPTNWTRWRDGKPTYCNRACIKAKQAAEAHARNPDQPCTTCGKPFALSQSQRDKIKSRAGTGLYCSTECLYKSRVVNFQKRRESGKLPVWGSPAQIAAAKKLGEYSRDNKVTGPAHPKWKDGKWTNEAKAERRAKWEQRLERRAAVPKQYPCMVCGVGFVFTRGQRERWYKHGTSVRYCCSHCKNKSMIAEKPPYYYAPMACAVCNTMFTPEESQRVDRHRNRDAKGCCSDTCLSAFRTQRLYKYREINGIMEGPTHPSWKSGGHSKQVQEAQRLIVNIKRYIKEGAKA